MKSYRIALNWIVPKLDPCPTSILVPLAGSQVYGLTALGEDNWCDIAGLISSGPIDHLAEIIVDGQKVWPDSGPGLYRSGQPNPVRITVKHYYTAWLYWDNSGFLRRYLRLRVSAGRLQALIRETLEKHASTLPTHKTKGFLPKSALSAPFKSLPLIVLTESIHDSANHYSRKL